MAGIAGALFVASFSPLAPEKVSDPQGAHDAAPLLMPASDRHEESVASRLYYPYSVVPGGVHSTAELASALADPVVAEHYGTVNVAAVREETVRAPRQVYVSYRVGNDIFWTKRTVALRPGEQVLTDGQTEIRGRCGNAISDTPQEPTSDDEPLLTEFDRAIPVARNDAPGPYGVPSPLPPGVPLAAPPLADFIDPVPGDGVILGGPPPGRSIPSFSLGGPTPGGSSTGSAQPSLFESASPGLDDPGGDVPIVPAGPPPSIGPPTGNTPPLAVPEPGSLLLVSTGLAATAWRAWRRRRRNGAPLH